MDSLIKADIFFFITTIAVVCVSLSIIVISVYVVRILRDIRNISEKARLETDFIIADIRELRNAIKEEGVKLKSISEMLMHFIPVKNKSRSKVKKETN